MNRSLFGDGDLHVFSGRALVMVTSHDCHHHKEWNTKRGRLIKRGFSAQQAEEIANSDDTLDRTFHASPLVPLTDLDEKTMVTTEPDEWWDPSRFLQHRTTPFQRASLISPIAAQ